MPFGSAVKARPQKAFLISLVYQSPFFDNGQRHKYTTKFRVFHITPQLNVLSLNTTTIVFLSSFIINELAYFTPYLLSENDL
jgi:hypothetical protein